MRTAALCIGADVFEIADHVIDVIIEIEGPFGAPTPTEFSKGLLTRAADAGGGERGLRAAVGQLEEIRGLVGDDDDSSNEAIVAAACFLPPLALALSGPNVFLPLLSLTGGYANTYLFGLLPCLLAWKHREASEAGEEILPGGRYSLSALGSGAATMVVSAGLGDAAHAISTAVPHV